MTAAALVLSISALASINAADLDGAPPIVSAAREAAPAPESAPALNRFELKLQPFLGLTGNSWGGFGGREVYAEGAPRRRRVVDEY